LLKAPLQRFWLFALFRGVFGIGEASYATIAPSVIADMFTGHNRSRMLMIFYFAIPFGSGLGFIVGSKVAALTGQWEWGIRITVIFGIIFLLLIIVFIEEPERGAAERQKGEIATAVAATSYWDDMKALVTNLTYVFGTVGCTALVFMVGTLSWWAPTTIEHSDAHKLGLNSTNMLDPDSKAKTNLIFGAITCVGGIVGVGLGSTLSMVRLPNHITSGCPLSILASRCSAAVTVPLNWFGLHDRIQLSVELAHLLECQLYISLSNSS
ncbi:spinster domain protein, partial [Ancylostoma ceylanicum]